MLGSCPFLKKQFLHSCLTLLVDMTGIGWNLHPPNPGASPKPDRMLPKAIFYGPVGFIQLFLGDAYVAPGVVGKRAFHFKNNNLCGFLLYFVCGQPCSSTVFVGIPEGFPGSFWDVCPGERLPQGHTWSNTFYCKCHFHGTSYQKDARHCKTTYWNSSKPATAFPCPLPSMLRLTLSI